MRIYVCIPISVWLSPILNRWFVDSRWTCSLWKNDLLPHEYVSMLYLHIPESVPSMAWRTNLQRTPERILWERLMVFCKCSLNLGCLLWHLNSWSQMGHIWEPANKSRFLSTVFQLYPGFVPPFIATRPGWSWHDRARRWSIGSSACAGEEETPSRVRRSFHVTFLVSNYPFLI